MLTACETDLNQKEEQNRKSEVTEFVFNSEWHLTELNGDSISEPGTSQSVPTVRFDESENRFYGRGGCNQYGGGFELDTETGEVEFSQIAATKMACPDMDLENQYFSMLDEVERMEHSSQILKFYNNSGETIAKFEFMEN